MKEEKQKNNRYRLLRCNENGSALIFALLILVVLTVLGISSLTTSTVEVKISGNDKRHKQAFYAADGGTEVGRELVEQNIACAVGFQTEPLTIASADANVSTEIVDDDFAFQETPPAGSYPSDTVRDIHFPLSDAVPHTNIVAFGNTQLSSGSAIQIAAGYEGKGKGSGASGAEIIYEIHSQHVGTVNTQSTIRIHYRHLIGQEGNCNY